MNPRFERSKHFLQLSLAFLATTAFAQQSGGGNPELQEKIAALKKSMAQSQQALRQYTWIETTQVILKGETKSTTQASCQYAADGKVVKTPVDTAQPQQKQPPRGVKGKVVANKKEEMSDYMKSAVALIQLYIPPDPARLQDTFKAGKAEMQQSAGSVVTLAFHDYIKPGDSLSLAINGQTSTMQSVSVKSYLDDAKDAVNLTVRFATLPDGANYAAETVLDATAKQLQVRTTNSGYRKL
jgi:hypothetical protein